MESLLAVVVPEAGPHVRSVRERFDPGVNIGIPPHITALYPFFDAEEISQEVEENISEILGHTASFRFRLSRIGSFDDAIYLAPEPDDPFIRLTKTIWDKFPEYPPFGGQFETIVPHLTVAWRSEGASIEDVEALLANSLPITCAAEALTLLIEEDDGWVPRGTFSFGHWFAGEEPDRSPDPS